MNQKVMRTSFVVATLISASSFASEKVEHYADGQLSSCITACLHKDTELNKVTLKTVLQESESPCLMEDYNLHARSILAFMRYGRSKDYIMSKLGPFMETNSVATMKCLFDAVLMKLNEDSKMTRDCLSKCEEADFRPITFNEEL